MQDDPLLAEAIQASLRDAGTDGGAGAGGGGSDRTEEDTRSMLERFPALKAQVEGLRFRIYGVEFRIYVEFRIWGRMYGVEFRIYGVGSGEGRVFHVGAFPCSQVAEVCVCV